jgi:hypothetical protein
MNNFLTENNLLLLFAFTAGLVSIIELLEYLVTKNIPWFVRLIRSFWKGFVRRFRKTGNDESVRQLVLNFSGHPVLPGQKQVIEKSMHWHSSEVLNFALGNVPEDHNFVSSIEEAVGKIPLSPEEWQTMPMVVIPAGYSAVWSVVLAELHGRLGYFPEVVRLRPAVPPATEKFEVAEIINLREVRHSSRDKR